MQIISIRNSIIKDQVRNLWDQKMLWTSMSKKTLRYRPCKLALVTLELLT